MDGKFYWFDYNETIKDSPLKVTWKVVEGYEMECIIDDSCLLEDDLERNIGCYIKTKSSVKFYMEV